MHCNFWFVIGKNYAEIWHNLFSRIFSQFNITCDLWDINYAVLGKILNFKIKQPIKYKFGIIIILLICINIIKFGASPKDTDLKL
jgi:hypothetical protein